MKSSIRGTNQMTTEEMMMEMYQEMKEMWKEMNISFKEVNQKIEKLEKMDNLILDEVERIHQIRLKRTDDLQKWSRLSAGPRLGRRRCPCGHVGHRKRSRHRNLCQRNYEPGSEWKMGSHSLQNVQSWSGLRQNALKAGAASHIEPKDVTIQSNPPLDVRIAFVKGPSGEIIEFFHEK